MQILTELSLSYVSDIVSENINPFFESLIDDLIFTWL